MIYALLDNGTPYYVGRTKDPHTREIALRSRFKRPTELIVLDADDSLETYWIHQMQTWGFDLLNKSQRIDTNHNELRKYGKHTPEALAKISAASKKQWAEGKHDEHGEKLKELWQTTNYRPNFRPKRT